MHLTQTTDYGIRFMLYLAGRPYGLPVPGREIIPATGISENYLLKVGRSLRLGGLVRTAQGVQGGFYLARPAEEITLYDIVAAMEGRIKLNACLEKGQPCSWSAPRPCAVHDCFERIQNYIEQELKCMNLAALRDRTLLLNECAPKQADGGDGQ